MTTVSIDTKKRIIEAAAYLFAEKGFDGTSTREIGRRAGVNIASLNYHYKSKQNLMEEVASFAVFEFRQRLQMLTEENVNSTEEFAVKLFQTLHADGHRSLNLFKIFLDSEHCDILMGETPICYDELNLYLSKDLNSKVPESERLWFYHVVFNYLMHTVVMSLTNAGKSHFMKYYPKEDKLAVRYITQLVQTLIRDLNQRYA